MPNRIVFASDTTPLYAFFVPLTCEMWQRVGGRLPTVMLVGDAATWQQESPVAYRYTQETGADVRFVAPVPGWKTGSVAQLARLFAFALPGIGDDENLMTTDADAWPLQAAAFQPRDKAIYILRAGGWWHFPMGYIGTSAKVWREVMASQAQSVEEGLREIDVTLQHQPPGWGHDESLVTRQIKAWPGFPDAVELVDRPNNCAGNRLDRVGWPAGPIDLAGYIDAHLLRPAWTDDDWPRMRWVLARYLPPERLAWADRYRDEFKAGA